MHPVKTPRERHEFARGVSVGLTIGVLVGAAVAVALVLAWASLTGTFLAGPAY